MSQAQTPSAGPATATALGGKPPDPAWAWAPYEPDSVRPWNLQRASHLARRAGFGANWTQLQETLAGGPQSAVRGLLEGGPDTGAFNEAFDGYDKAAGSAEALAAWWLRRMIETPHPLLERMTLFWHDYFAVSDARVNNPALVCRYLRMLRGHALGRFDGLLEAVVDDPAVLMAFNARTSHKARPATDFPRALLGQFTVGPGQFSEADVAAAARALTGWYVNQGELGFNPLEHDAGRKTLLGQTGDLARKDVVGILVRHPATLGRVAGKLYRWFISETEPPAAALLAPLENQFAKDLDLARLVETMLRSNLFFASAGQRIKSPVELALGLIRPLEGNAATVPLAAAMAALGQDLLRPPTTKGWAGGMNWLNRFTLLGRARLAEDLLAGSGPYGGKLDPQATAAKHGQTGREMGAAFLFDLLLPDSVAKEKRAALLEGAGAGEDAAEGLRRLAGQLAALPEFNLA